MGYKNLLTYKQAEEIYDLTVRFCDLHINKRSRTHDQMVQAARSGKQNIAEGASQQTSLKFYIKEIGISRGSFEELLEDYLDFARQHGIKIWERGDERVEKVKRGEKGERMKFFFSFFSSKPSSSFPSNPSLPSSPLLQLFINYMADLLKRTNYLLDQQRRSLEKKFAEEGGYTENLFKKRLKKRSSSKTFFPLILFSLFPFLTFAILFTFFPSNPAKAANINFTLETWLKPATSVATKAILVKNNEMRLVTDGSGNPSCQIYSTDWQTAAVSSAAISTGSWQHVACTYDGTNIKVYVGGTLTDTEAETADVNNTVNGMIAGYDAGLTYNKFEGQIDSVRIFNRALSANEIKAHYDLGNLAQDGDNEDGDAAEFTLSNSTAARVNAEIGIEEIGLMGEWLFNTGSDSFAYDTSGRENVGYLHSPALSFDGGDYVNVGNEESLDFGTNDFTITTWIKYLDNVGIGGIVCKNLSVQLMILSDVASFDLYDGVNNPGCPGSTLVTDNNWHFIAGVRDSTHLNLYVDGILENSASDTTNDVSSLDNWNIGVRRIAQSEYFTGLIDSVRIYSRALSATEVAEHYKGIYSDNTNLVGYWKMDEGTGQTVADSSGQGNNGTLGADSGSSTDDPTWIDYAPDWTASGKFDDGVSFDGTDDKIEIADDGSMDFAAADDFTITGWFKHDTISTASDYIITKHESGTAGGYKVYMDSDGDIAFAIDDDGTWGPEDAVGDDQSDNLDDNEWHHFAAVKDGTTGIYLYIDKTQTDSDESLTSTGSLANASSTYIGIDADGSTGSWAGLLDSIRVYNKVLAADEIAANYNGSRSKFDNYAAKIELLSNDASVYLDESLTNGQDYLASFWYHPGEDNANAIRFKVSGSADPIMAEHNLMASSAMGLVGAWNFESSATPSVDISGNSNSLTWNGTAAQSTSGKFGSAIDLDGDSDYLNKTDADSLDLSTSATISAWIKLDDLAAQHSLADKGTNYGVHIDTSGYLTWDNGIEYKDTTAISAATWTHIAVTNDGTTAKYYVNGAYSSSDTAGFAAVNASDLRIGYDGTNYFQGLIDNLRIYNRALTSSEVYDRYKAGDWHKYELSFEADQTGAHLFKFIQDGSTSGNSIVYVDNFRVDKNLAEDGGMESAEAGTDPYRPTDWSFTTDSPEATESDVDSTVFHTGSNSFELINADDGEGIKQTITVESGKWYTLSIYGKNDNQDVEATLATAATATIDLTTSNNSWTKFNKTFLSSDVSLVLSIVSGAAEQDGYFDDVSLVELDSYTGATTATTTTPTVAASSYGKGRWGEASGSIMIDGGDTLAYPTANNIYSDEGTVAFWVKPGMDYNDFSENKYLWSVEGVARLYYNYSDYKFYFEIYDGSAWGSVQAVSSAQTFTEDTWLHISASWNDRKNLAYLYINGANDGSSTWGWYGQTLPTNMYFGAEYDGTNNADMYFDDVRVYDHSLSAEDIHRMYGSSPDPSASQLRLHIPFTYGGGTGIGVNGTGLYDLTGTFTAGWGYKPGKVSGEYALGFFGSDNLQFSRGDQVDGYVYEYITPYQGTIKTWVKPAFDGSEATTNIIFQNGSSNYVKLYRHSSGALYWDIYDGTTTHRVSNDVSDWTAGTWYHVAAVWSNENTVSTSSTQYLMELYVNGGNGGNSYSNATFNTNFWAAFAPGTSYIGEDSSAANQFNGLIGGFAIDDKPWSEDEVSTDYNSGSGTLTSVSQDTLLYLPADSSDTDGMITWDKSPDVAVADGNMEDGDVAEWAQGSEGSELHTSANAASDPNGNEANAITGWVSNIDTFESSPADKNKGSYSLHMAEATGGIARSNASSVTVGKLYKATLDVKVVSGNVRIYSFDGSGNAETLLETVNNAGWVSKIYYFRATTTGVLAGVGVYNQSAFECYIDNVSIKEAQAASAEGGTVADEDGLVGGWNFEDNATDVSGNGNTGTVYGLE